MYALDIHHTKWVTLNNVMKKYYEKKTRKCVQTISFTREERRVIKIHKR